MGVLDWLGLKPEPQKEPDHITDANFKTEVLKSDIPVLLDVWSFGCQPCKALVPTIMKLAAKYEGRVKVAELNISQNPRTAGRLGVRGTPTVLFFKNGKIIERVVGLRGQHYYEDIIENDLLAGTVQNTQPKKAEAEAEANASSASAPKDKPKGTAHKKPKKKNKKRR